MTIPQDLIDCVSDLIDIITRENAALEAVDLAGAAAMAHDKQSATERLTRARADTVGLTHEHAAILRPLGERLEELAAVNRTLLERGIYVQGRVISSIVRAIPRAATQTRYGADGIVAAKGQPVAFVARA